jgi:hypothetical protein
MIDGTDVKSASPSSAQTHSVLAGRHSGLFRRTIGVAGLILLSTSSGILIGNSGALAPIVGRTYGEIEFREEYGRAFQRGQERGGGQGRDDGKTEGYAAGLKRGHQQGHRQGLKAGGEKGYEQGRKAGYRAGEEEGRAR